MRFRFQAHRHLRWYHCCCCCCCWSHSDLSMTDREFDAHAWHRIFYFVVFVFVSLLFPFSFFLFVLFSFSFCHFHSSVLLACGVPQLSIGHICVKIKLIFYFSLLDLLLFVAFGVGIHWPKWLVLASVGKLWFMGIKFGKLFDFYNFLMVQRLAVGDFRFTKILQLWSRKLVWVSYIHIYIYIM